MTVIPETPMTHVTPSADTPAGTVHSWVTHTAHTTATSAGMSHRPRRPKRKAYQAVQQLRTTVTATRTAGSGVDSKISADTLMTRKITIRSPREYRTPVRSNSRSVLPNTRQPSEPDRATPVADAGAAHRRK